MRNAVEALFQLERGCTREDVLRVFDAVRALLHDPEQAELRHTFSLWIGRLLQRKAGTSNMQGLEDLGDLLETDTMLAERIENWFDEATQKGMQKGMQQGMQQGMRKGMQQGVLKGEANILSKLLRLRFGALSPKAVERLSRATESELDAWSEAVLSAPTLEAVFEAASR